jgi:chromosome segregation ATPase
MDMTEAEEKALREQAYDDTEPEPPGLPPEPEGGLPLEPKEEDPWAGVPTALREQLQQISERITTIDNIDYRLKQTERRLGGIQNEFYAAQKAAKEQKEAPTEQEMKAASKTAEAWAGLKEDFPEWAEAIESKIADVKPDIEKIRADIKADLQQGSGTNEDMERRLVGIAHRDWQDVVKSSDYQAWLQGQPQALQQKALYGQTAEDAIEVLDKFKAAKKKPPDNIKDRLEKAVDAPRGPARKPPKSEADLTDAELRQQIASEVWS